MILYTLWIKRTYSDREGMAPEMIEAWDEFAIDENYDGWEAACATALDSIGTDLLVHRIIKVAVNYDAITQAFNSTVTPGTVV